MNAGEKLVALSVLPSGSAKAHLLAITKGTVPGVDRFIFASQVTVCVEEPSVTVLQTTQQTHIAYSPEARSTLSASETGLDGVEYITVRRSDAPRIDCTLTPERWTLHSRPNRITAVQSLPNPVIASIKNAGWTITMPA